MKKLLFLFALAILGTPSLTKAGVQDRLFDFTDAYYQQNGINPAAIDGRRQVGPLAVTDTPIFPYQRNVRALLTLPNYDHSGNAWYFTVLGGFSASAFTNDGAGARAANRGFEYRIRVPAQRDRPGRSRRPSPVCYARHAERLLQQ